MMQVQAPVVPSPHVVHEDIREEHVEAPAERSLLPRFRRTFNHFSSQGIMTRGGGVVSGELRIQMRKGFMNRTRVLVSYADHSVFIEVEGSPLEGDVKPRDIFRRLRRSGMVRLSQSQKF